MNGRATARLKIVWRAVLPRLRRYRLLTPLLAAGGLVWRLTGRPGGPGRMLFWAALEQEDFTAAGAILDRLETREGRPDRRRSDWNRTARLMLDNRRPVDLDALCGRAHDLIRARISGHLKSMT